MEESLYNIYLAYREKLIDDDFINKVYELMIQKEPYLLPYINDFKISEDKNETRGTYSPKDKVITIYKGSINGIVHDQKGITGIETIKHEMEHAKNARKLDERRTDIESRVLQYSAYLYSKISDLMARETNKNESIDLLSLLCTRTINYDYDPDERLAEIRAWRYVINLLKNQRNSEDLLFARLNLRNNYVRGYKDNGYYLECPTYTYLLNTGQIRELKQLKNAVESKNYSFENRVLYGLPLTYKEYDKGILDKVLLQRKKVK